MQRWNSQTTELIFFKVPASHLVRPLIAPHRLALVLVPADGAGKAEGGAWQHVVAGGGGVVSLPRSLHRGEGGAGAVDVWGARGGFGYTGGGKVNNIGHETLKPYT